MTNTETTETEADQEACEYEGCSHAGEVAAYTDEGPYGPVFLCSEHAQKLLDVLATDEPLYWRFDQQDGCYHAEEIDEREYDDYPEPVVIDAATEEILAEISEAERAELERWKPDEPLVDRS
jgi:hypothetical protein